MIAKILTAVLMLLLLAMLVALMGCVYIMIQVILDDLKRDKDL